MGNRLEDNCGAMPTLAVGMLRYSFPGSAWERTVREAPPRRTRRVCRRRHGLTLIEMMLVLALIVVLASFCWPAINRAFASQRLKKSADIVPRSCASRASRR
jgi:prepilin-type N-terminal cleavage/methylation domain-containing protein